MVGNEERVEFVKAHPLILYDTDTAVNNLLPYSVGCVTVRPMSSAWSLKQHWPKP